MYTSGCEKGFSHQWFETTGGDLVGTIAVVGCHETDDDLEICLCGGDGAGNITITQPNCTNQVVASCSSNCN